MEQLTSEIAVGRLKTVPIDLVKTQMFMEKASEAIGEFANISSVGVLYDTAYTVCHDIGEATMAAYGYKPAPIDGHHAVLGEFLTILFSNSPARIAVTNFDDLRKSRNSRMYSAKPIGKSLAELAMETAKELFSEAKTQLN